jgi:hypothetical protein
LDVFFADFAPWDLNKFTNASWPYPNVPGTAQVGHECNGWDGFTFNATLFPDPARFFNDTRSRFGTKMILSVHMQERKWPVLPNVKPARTFDLL